MRTVYREKRYYCGEYLDVYIYPTYTQARSRGKRSKPTSAAQKKLMYWRDVVTLKAVTEGRDADGFPKEAITETTVFADVSSTKRSEFYAARQAGISLALTVKLRAADYDGQERLSYEGKEYKVERAYTEAREYYELNCSEFREASE